MSSFTGRLRYTRLANGLASCQSQMRFYLDDKREGEYVELEDGSLSNFASIPKLLQFICSPDAQDIKVPSFFHDGMVAEHGQQIWIKRDNSDILRIPTWKESAFWFRKMIEVRQRKTRNKYTSGKRFLLTGVDFIFRWSCWGAVTVHGLVR